MSSQFWPLISFILCKQTKFYLRCLRALLLGHSSPLFTMLYLVVCAVLLCSGRDFSGRFRKKAKVFSFWLWEVFFSPCLTSCLRRPSERGFCLLAVCVCGSDCKSHCVCEVSCL